MNISALKFFYTNVSQIVSKHTALATVTGDNFNVFRILGLESAEVRTHSAFLSELLNAKGSHGQGGLYLRLFTEQFLIKDFDTVNSASEVEKYISPIAADNKNGGRIDIFIEDKDNRQILIENKIYAADQENQLLRYHRYNPKADLIYLTLDGNAPSEYSTGNALSAENMLCLSYKDHIMSWLRDCQKESVSKPLIRETIAQYIVLLSHLTGRIENQNMSLEIRNFIVGNPELLEAIEACSKELQELKSSTRNQFFSKMENSFSSRKEVIRLEGDITISAEWGEDGDGVHFGYKARRHDKIISSNPELGSIVATLKEIDSNFRCQGDWLGWVNPDSFRGRKRFIHLPTSELVSFNQNETLLDELVQKIVNQEKAIREKLLRSFEVPIAELAS
jgi:hypothetical protein